MNTTIFHLFVSLLLLSEVSGSGKAMMSGGKAGKGYTMAPSDTPSTIPTISPSPTTSPTVSSSPSLSDQPSDVPSDQPSSIPSCAGKGKGGKGKGERMLSKKGKGGKGGSYCDDDDEEDLVVASNLEQIGNNSGGYCTFSSLVTGALIAIGFVGI